MAATDAIRFESAIGWLVLEEKAGAITALSFGGPGRQAGIEADEAPSPLLLEARSQVLAYLSGRRSSFDLPLAPEGTPFQQKVWQALRAIPYGKTAAYGEIAAAIGSPGAARAVGMANNRNPIAIIIPCHRVVGSGGSLGGYSGGLHIKQRLLEIEARKLFGCP